MVFLGLHFLLAEVDGNFFVFFSTYIGVEDEEAAEQFVIALFELIVGDGEGVDNTFFFDSFRGDAVVLRVGFGVLCGFAFGEIFEEFFDVGGEDFLEFGDYPEF